MENSQPMNRASARFSDNRPLQLLAGSYAILWILLAIKPVDRGDWFLENLLVFATMLVVLLTYHRFQFSNLTYALLGLFLALHAIGAHYTYAKVPAGFWLQDWFHLNRNHFDRIIHFGFGLFLFYPVYELLHRAGGVRGAWLSWLALAAIVAMSSFFEILEGFIAQIVRPDLGTAYLGTQGDIWDAQKDMIAAVVGGILAAFAVAIVRRQRA
jgi:putative membrane protein